jgi:Mg2+ and Co2+ transporter CorA
VSQAVNALGRVLKRRLAELDRQILDSTYPREVRRLYRTRRRVMKLWRILTGFAE